MATTPTDSGRVRKIQPGTETNTWGDLLNTNFDLLDDQIDGLVVVPLTGNLTLSSANYAEDQSRNLILKFTGGGPWTVTVPPQFKRYVIWNACTSAVTITAGAGSVAVDPTDIVLVICDKVDVKTLGYNGLSLKDYIASVVIGTISGIPSVAGNLNKVMWSDAVSAFWKTLVTTDISDYGADQTSREAAATGRAIAFAIAL